MAEVPKTLVLWLKSQKGFKQRSVRFLVEISPGVKKSMAFLTQNKNNFNMVCFDGIGLWSHKYKLEMCHARVTNVTLMWTHSSY